MTEQDADTETPGGAGESGDEEGAANGSEQSAGSETDLTEEDQSARGASARASNGEREQDDGDDTEMAAAEDADGETLESIAEKPAGDVDEALADIVGSQAEDDAEADVAAGDEIVEDELLADVKEAEPDTLARAIQLLRQEVGELESRLTETSERADDLEERLKRKQADFQNYKKRQKRKLEDEKQRATEDLVTRLLDVRDNLARALDQDEDVDIRDGVASTLDQFDQQLDRENVTPIEPEPGEEVRPQRHEVLATIESDEPEDAIAVVHRPGYEMAEKVLRPAQVAVSDGSLADEVGGDEADAADEDEDLATQDGESSSPSADSNREPAVSEEEANSAADQDGTKADTADDDDAADAGTDANTAAGAEDSDEGSGDTDTHGEDTEE